MRPPRETPHPSETALQNACRRRIREEHGGEVMKVHGGAAQSSGQPDLIGCVRGRMVALELKQPGKRPTPLQAKRLRDWAAAGALAGWATTEAEMEALLEHVDEPGWHDPRLDV